VKLSWIFYLKLQTVENSEKPQVQVQMLAMLDLKLAYIKSEEQKVNTME